MPYAFTDEMICDMLGTLPEKTRIGVRALVKRQKYKEALALVLAAHLAEQATTGNALYDVYHT